MATVLTFLWLCSVSTHAANDTSFETTMIDDTDDDNITINIYAIVTSFTVGESIQIGHEIAIDFINSDPDILPSYHLNLTVLQSGDDSTAALLHALEISKSSSDHSHTYDAWDFPIVLGCDWSSLSTVTTPTLSAFQWGQISSSSTSLILSETTSFPYFYRVISNDLLQSKALIELCKTFDWRQIGVIHVNDNYGVYLSVSISELATSANIEVSSIAFERNKNDSYLNAASSMKEIGVYIIIIASHGDDDLRQIFLALHANGMMQYPYFYMATDAWMDPRVLRNITSELSHFQGMIGTMPWQPNTLGAADYEAHNLSTMHEIASVQYDRIHAAYMAKLGSNNHNNNTVMGTRVIYGYESVRVLAQILAQLDEAYDLSNFSASDYHAVVQQRSHWTLHATDYYGVTGQVAFDGENGDRVHGLFSYGYITDDGNVESFGFAYEQRHEESLWGGVGGMNGSTSVFIDVFQASINESLIQWPSAFTERHVRPQSAAFDVYVVTYIAQPAWIMMTVLASIGIVCIIAYMVYAYFVAPKLPSDFKLHVVMYSGVALAYVYMIVSGVDERIYEPAAEDNSSVADAALTVLCNVRIWCVALAFTLILTPGFAITYRLSRIFTELLITKNIPDSKLLVRVLLALAMDVLILLVFVCITPFERSYVKGRHEQLDALQHQQYVTGVCRIGDARMHYAFMVVMSLWKAVELVLGVYVSIIVSRMGFKSQIVIVCLVALVLLIAVLCWTFGPSDAGSFTYVVSCVAILLITNLVMWQKYVRRKCKRNDEDDDAAGTHLTDEEKMKELLKQRLQEIARTENWNSFSETSMTPNVVPQNTENT